MNKPMDVDTAFILSQAAQIKRLTADLRKLVEAQAAEIKRLTDAMDDAPHASECHLNSTYRPWEQTCNCWKAALMQEDKP